MDIITASAMFPYISILLSEFERREAEDALFEIEARARGYVPERTCRIEKWPLGIHADDEFVDICSNCRTDIDESYYYCPNCGARVKEGECE